MTPTEIETASRNKYNSIGDSFFSQPEILDLMWEGCIDLVRETNLIERVYSSSTVIAQQEYQYPTSTQSIKRVTYEGKKLAPIDFVIDDSITGFNAATTAQGTPQYYFEFNQVIYLRPIPSAVGTLKIFSYNTPERILITSTLEIPTQFQISLVNYIVSEMAAKDSNFDAAKFYSDRWEKSKLDVKKFQRLRKRGDSFNVVKDESQFLNNYLVIA